jgi:predicted RNA polymerase sigma factor
MLTHSVGDRAAFLAVQPYQCKCSTSNLVSAAIHAGLKSWKHAVFFGNNLVTQQSSGTVTVGDAVRVTMLRGTSQDGALVWKDLTK